MTAGLNIIKALDIFNKKNKGNQLRVENFDEEDREGIDFESYLRKPFLTFCQSSRDDPVNLFTFLKSRVRNQPNFHTRYASVPISLAGKCEQ